MNFRSLLEEFPSGTQKELYVSQVQGSPERFQSLLDLALEDQDPVSWRAAWILDSCDETETSLREAQICDIVKSLPSLQSKGALRSLLRMLVRHEIPDEEQGLLVDLCFRYLVSDLYPVAVKAHAMQIIYQHVLLYPELKDELITILQDQIENNSVGFKSRAVKLIKAMEKL